jgi:putative oxidoreductase
MQASRYSMRISPQGACHVVQSSYRRRCHRASHGRRRDVHRPRSAQVFRFTLPGTAKFFESLGLPGALGYVTVAAELIGGALLVAGVRTRQVALLLTPFVLGATWAHWGNGWVFTAQNGGWEYPAFLTLASIVTAILGNGARDEIESFASRAVQPSVRQTI